VITRLRKASKGVLRPLARAAISLGLTANSVTVIGLILSIAYLTLAFVSANPVILAMLLALSSLMDAVDGEVARIRGTAGPRGAFLDSTLDRVEDTAFILGLIPLGYNSLVVGLLLGLSIIIPYIRARGEAAGLKVEGRGLIERGERLIGLFLIVVFTALWRPLAESLLYLLTALSALTVVQRFWFVYVRLPK
jgi:archaetidylinositol phosphate synthase